VKGPGFIVRELDCAALNVSWQVTPYPVTAAYVKEVLETARDRKPGARSRIRCDTTRRGTCRAIASISTAMARIPS
jgi:hypothetical protein